MLVCNLTQLKNNLNFVYFLAYFPAAIFVAITLVLLYLCWREILYARRGTKVSKRTLEMQQNLLIALTIQVNLKL
jgi:hypothetical protein